MDRALLSFVFQFNQGILILITEICLRHGGSPGWTEYRISLVWKHLQIQVLCFNYLFTYK